MKAYETCGKYITDYYNIKELNANVYKLTYCKMPIKRRGFEEEKRLNRGRDVNDEKLDNNIARARTRVFEYAVCNDFEYFITLTINGDKLDRYDLNGYIKKLGQFIRNYRRDYGANIQYLLIPEKHKDGAWHLHGLVKGIPKNHLHINENGYLDWQKYKDRFGYCSLDRIRSKEAVSRYITKYIGKSFDTDRGVTDKERKLYYCSRGLKKPVKIKEGIMYRYQLKKIPFKFENDYVKMGIYNAQQYEHISKIIDNDIISI